MTDIEGYTHDDYVKLVRKYVARKGYSPTNQDYDDLIQLCLICLYRNLHKYDAKRSALSTYINQICNSVTYLQWHRKIRKRMETFVSLDDDTKRSALAKTPVVGLSSDMLIALEALRAEHPKYEHCFDAIFGNIDDPDFVPDFNVNCCEIERRTGIPQFTLNYYLTSKVRPHMQRWFRQ